MAERRTVSLVASPSCGDRIADAFLGALELLWDLAQLAIMLAFIAALLWAVFGDTVLFPG